MPMLLNFLAVSLIGHPLYVTTDLAQYKPGETVAVEIVGTGGPGSKLNVDLYQDGEKIAGIARGLPWTGKQHVEFAAPPVDGQGYLIVASLTTPLTHFPARGSCGVDVSSSWLKFPRYGYLAHYGPELAAQAPSLLENLKDFHINGIQFYDWQWKHHIPLAPTQTWPDLANRTTSAQTVSTYIAEAHKRGISCMAYNLLFGAAADYETDGVQRDWGLFEDASKAKQWSIDLPGGWATPKLELFNPANPDWKNYLFSHEKKALDAFGFDGWHVDQLGDFGPKYDASGKAVDLPSAFREFLDAAQKATGKPAIFNNVAGFGLDQTLKSDAPVTYVEAWPWAQKSYLDLQATVDKARSTGRPAILAAYMDKELAARYEGKTTPGAFNPAGVLLTDAVILASGGDHLELGDDLNMLDHEYFPNRNLIPSSDLLVTLRSYYDFMVGYETLLRGTSAKPVSVQVERGKAVWAFARAVGSKIVVHLINLSDPKAPWADATGTVPAPEAVQNVAIQVDGAADGSAFWATPDDGLGAPQTVRVSDGVVTVPRVGYWSMVVLNRS